MIVNALDWVKIKRLSDHRSNCKSSPSNLNWALLFRKILSKPENTVVSEAINARFVYNYQKVLSMDITKVRQYHESLRRSECGYAQLYLCNNHC